MTPSSLQILSDFESALTSGKVRGIEEFYKSLLVSEHSAELVSDLARAELYFSKWPRDRLRQNLDFANDVDPHGTAYSSIVTGVYVDRVECGEQPRLEDFPGLEVNGCSLRSPNDPLGLGDQCGRFQIVCRVGAGAFGAVFEGQAESGERVAIKSPFFTGIRGQADLAWDLLKAEAEAAQQLAGSTFPSFVDWIELDDGHPCLATEFIDGANLRDLLRANPLEPKAAAAIVAGVAEALYLAHAKGFVHRDVKPANIMVRNGRAAENRKRTCILVDG